MQSDTLQKYLFAIHCANSICFSVRLCFIFTISFTSYVVFSFIPIVGTAPITLFFLISSFIQGNTTHTILILITISMMFVIDNLIKPLLIGKQTHIHPVLAFMSALGGLTLFGFYGLFLGPIAVGILIDLIRE
jgi:predicted PurR-regulated permease PerM